MVVIGFVVFIVGVEVIGAVFDGFLQLLELADLFFVNGDFAVDLYFFYVQICAFQGEEEISFLGVVAVLDFDVEDFSGVGGHDGVFVATLDHSETFDNIDFGGEEAPDEHADEEDRRR